MNIEVIGNLRVKCTLTSEYLKSRWIDLADLAYGSDEATALFRDIIEETKERFGIDFGAKENHPFMIEAIPMGEGVLDIIISKVEEAEELDTRFSRFTPGIADGNDDADYGDDYDDEEDEPAFRAPKEHPKPAVRKAATYGKPFFEVLEKEKDKIRESGCIVTISFKKLSDLMKMAESGPDYSGPSSVYKCADGSYLLVITADGEDFAKAMSFAGQATEFGNARIIPRSGAAFLDRDHEVLIASDALKKLTLK